MVGVVDGWEGSFGPSAKAAMIEGSKKFSKDLMKKYNIPTAEYATFTDFESALAYIKSVDHPVVIKASGLAAGKGVLLPERGEEEQALRDIMMDHEFGAAGDTVVIEERLEGEEVSLLCFTDGETIITMPPSQDHKRVGDNDVGPNTGGMGAYAPAPCLPPYLRREAAKEVLERCVNGLKEEGAPFCGVLYAGLMLTASGIKVLEFNCRFGDPETEVILPLLDSDLFEIMEACCDHTLSSMKVQWKEASAVTVVEASAGYPGSYKKGFVISGLDKAAAREGVTVFHAGTKKQDDALVTSGGRVLTITAVAPSFRSALATAYAAVEEVTFEGRQFRHDIGGRAVKAGVRVGVLGSTRGTDMAAIQEAIEAGKLNAKIVCVISNIKTAGILEKAEKYGIPAVHITGKDVSREEQEKKVCEVLADYGVDLVLLIGYMRILSPAFFEGCKKMVLNVHPSLLPEYAGGMNNNVHEAVLKDHRLETGCTVHQVTPEVDCGPIMCQRHVPVYSFDTVDTLKARVQEAEGKALIECIREFGEGTLKEIEVAKEGVISYSDAGVDISEGDLLVENIKPFCKGTDRPGCHVDLGGFGGLFDLHGAGYGDPDTLLVACDDGVGTKVKLAVQTGLHDTVGQDLVAMSVNDLIVQGAEPLFFLDYYATGHLDAAQATRVVKGICDGCKLARCALIGGETAEMPSIYAEGEYDLAGFAVGAVKRQDVLPKPTHPDMVVFGLPSTGPHSNGYSLVRRLVDVSGLKVTDPCPFLPEKTLGEVLMSPTRIYVPSVLAACKTKKVAGFAHITGGGLLENIPRVLSPDTSCQINAGSWPVLDVFRWLKSVGNVPEPEMLRTFNCGLGMIVIAEKEGAAEVKAALESEGETVYEVGKIISTPGKNEVVMNGRVF